MEALKVPELDYQPCANERPIIDTLPFSFVVPQNCTCGWWAGNVEVLDIQLQ